MRLFIAIEFTEKLKKELLWFQKELRTNGMSGRFVPPENFHLTLAFIGEYHDPELVLEAMEMESRKTVRPVYFEAAVKVKYSRGGDDADMIDLMDQTAYSDFVYVWQFSAEMSGLGGWLRNNINAGGFNNVKRNQTKWKQGLDNIIEEINKLEGASQEGAQQ